MTNLRKRLYEYIEKNLLDPAVLSGIELSSSGRQLRKVVLEILLNLYFYFGAVWMVFLSDFDESKYRTVLTVIVITFMMLSLIVDLYMKVFINKKAESSNKRINLVMLKMVNLLFHHSLFVMIVVLLTNDRKLGRHTSFEEIFFNLVRYIISSISLCQGLFKLETLCFQFLFTVMIIQGWFILTRSQEGEAESEFKLGANLALGSKYVLLGLNILMLFYFYCLSQTQSISANFLGKIVKENESGIVILKKKSICYINKAMADILSKKSEEVDYHDLSSLTINRYVSFSDKMRNSLLKQEQVSKSPAHVSRKSLSLEESLEILKRAPKYPLTFYTSFDSKTQPKSESSCKSAKGFENSNIYKDFINFHTDGVKEFGDDSETAEVRHFEIKISFVDWDKFGDLYIFMRFSDFTEAQLVLEGERQKELNTHILNCFSHELRTPLNISKNMLDMIYLEETIPENIKKKFVTVAQASLEMLTNLIYDIVDFLKIETDQFELDLSRFSLNLVLDEVLGLIKHRCEEKSLKITTEYSQLVTQKLYSDRPRVKRIILNLLSFIVKMNSHSNIHLKLQKQGDDVYRLSFVKTFSRADSRDTNITLNTESCPAILRDLNYGYENDFGLLISKMLLTNLKNFGIDDFSFDEELSEGALFSIRFKLSPEQRLERDISISGRLTIPLELNELETLAKGLPISPNYSRNKINTKLIREYSELSTCPRVLIVDDDVFNVFALEMILEKMDIQVIKASNGQEAIDVLNAHKNTHRCKSRMRCNGIELILMDLLMPVMNGIDSSRILFKMMESGELPNATIIACSANDAKDIVSSCKQIGMADFLSKPINPAALRTKIRSYMSFVH